MSQTYKCPRCVYTVQLTTHEAAQVGTPICSDCDFDCEPIDNSMLYALAVELGIDSLDELVCDAKIDEAANINIEGLAGQIDYLVEHLGVEALEQKIREQPQSGNAWKPDSHWENHPRFSAEQWRAEAFADNTRLGYLDWVNARLDEQIHQSAAAVSNSSRKRRLGSAQSPSDHATGTKK